MTKPESKTSARILKAREREQMAVKLRLSGATYEQIGHALGISAPAAHKAVMRSLQRTIEKTDEDVEKIRHLELQRLDAMLFGLWQKAKEGHEGSVDRVLRIMERRAKLLGLDQQKLEHVVEGHLYVEHEYDEEELKEWERIQLAKASTTAGGAGG
jgi:hypothetical protein